MFKSIMGFGIILSNIFYFLFKLTPAIIGISLAPLLFMAAVFSAASYNPNWGLKLISKGLTILTIVLPVGGILTSVYLFFNFSFIVTIIFPIAFVLSVLYLFFY